MKKLLFLFCLFQLINLSAQQTEYVDFKRIEAGIEFVLDSSLVKGKYSVDLLIMKKVDTIFIDAKNILRLNNPVISYTKVDYTGKRLKGIDNVADFDIDIKYQDDKILLIYDFEERGYRVYFDYVSKPKKSLYFLKRDTKPQIWTQGQGKYTSNWLPSIDDVNDKIEFDLAFIFNSGYEIISNGKLDSQMTLFHPHRRIVNYNMQKPMSSYLVALAIGKYDKKIEISKSGIPIELYYYPEDSAKVEPTYRYTKQMFDFLEEEIGFGYPWQNYKQVPVHDFLYSGMENTSLTIFSDAYVVDEIGFNDKNYVNVNAHELAHQWFGDLVTATSGEHHWLQEGFAAYYALLAEKNVFGKNYFDFKLYNSAQDLAQQDLAGSGTSLLNPKSSSLTFYQRGAWVLYALRDKVGDKMFQNAVKNYLEKHQFGNVKTSDFISEVEVFYEKPLTDFVSKWIEAKAFPFNDAVKLLKEQSVFVQEYMMVDCEAISSKCEDYLKYYVSDQAKIKVIAQRPDLVSKATFSESLKVRQAISQYVTKIPNNLKDNYETLLDDKSYLTIESALYNLWINFPLERSKYLTKTRNIQGFNDKNVRLLWLVLALNTMEFQPKKNNDFLKELLSYTDASQNFELRMNAFTYLDLIKACGSECELNLEQAKTHHNWRMSKFAKDMLHQLNNLKN